ncbi:MAG: EutN/CcmL family microcompartment protein [bacterium]
MIGNVVSTIKEATYQRWKLLVVQPVDTEGKASEPSHLCIDLCQAGMGDYVLVLQEGNGLRFLTNQPKGAVDAAAVGVIDYVESGGRQHRLDAPPAPPAASRRKS